MPTYRRGHQIGEAIQSLLDGDFDDFGLYVCDDGDGTDITESVVAGIRARDPRVHYFRNPTNRRMPGNLNDGIVREAKGEFIAVCHDHDIYDVRFLSAQIKLLDEYPEALFCHCGIGPIGEVGQGDRDRSSKFPEYLPGREVLKEILRTLNCPICALTVVRARGHRDFGIYNEEYGFVADVEMWMRLSLNGDVCYCADTLVKVREREPDHFAHSAGGELAKLVVTMQTPYLAAIASNRIHLAVLHLMKQLQYMSVRLRLFASTAKKRLTGF